MKPSIYGLTRQALEDWVLEQGEKKFRATQIWEWLYRSRVQSFEEMTNLSKSFIERLNEAFVLNPLQQRIVQESKDGTVKYLFELPDGMLIETVLMRQHYGLSVCVTTQVGCNIGCTFCASGLIPKQRDLTSGEIVAQIMLVQKYFDERDQGERVSHIVVMGIGEPLDNYDNVMTFLRVVNDDKGLAIGPVISPFRPLDWHPRSAILPGKVSRSTWLFPCMRPTMICAPASCGLTGSIRLRSSLRPLKTTSRPPTAV